MTESDRLNQINRCMDFLHQCQSTFGKPNRSALANQIGELDQLEELHRLLYEENK